MGKTSKWIRNFLTGKKERDKENEREKEKNPTNQTTLLAAENPATTPILIPPTTPKEKRRWSFRRSSATAASQKNTNGKDVFAAAMSPAAPSLAEVENEQKKQTLAMAAATAAAADAAVAAAQAAAAVIRLSVDATGRASAMKEAAAIKIQSVFRSFLARKALCALKGLVKLQALVRGHLVRKQATATLRCMQALVTAQARARAQRIKMTEESKPNTYNYYQTPLLSNRRTAQDNRFRHTYHHEMEESIKIVEMDLLGESKGSTKGRNSYSNHEQTDRTEHHRFSTHSAPHHRPHSKQDHHREISPAPSALTDASTRACSSHFEDYSFGTAHSSPQHYPSSSSAVSKTNPFAFPTRPEYAADSLSYDCHFFPNYMANTESSRAKARSHSAPKARPEGAFESQLSRRRASLEGRNVPRAVRMMQRSSSQVGAAAAQIYQYPGLIKLDRSSVSLQESECGSTSTVLTNTIYCRSLVGFDVNGNRY